MAKFNTGITAGVNKAGGASFKRADKQEVAQLVLNSMLNGDMYYETEKERVNRIIKSCEDPKIAEFVAKAMVYARTEGGLRSVTHLMGAVLAENVKGSTYLRRALSKAIQRPDDMTEMLSVFTSRNAGLMVPNVLRRAFKDSLESKFDIYQLKKYASTKNKVKLKDIVKLAHPDPMKLLKAGKADSTDVFQMLIEDRLPNIATAQTVNAASTGATRANNYKAMLADRKLGYMAALKNMKNIIEAGADSETVDMLCTLLRNERACLNSKVLPFRFVQAYFMVDMMNMDRINAKKLMAAIEDGFVISARNIPFGDENTRYALLLDSSGSMGSMGYQEKSPFSIGKTMFASMMTGLNKDNVTGWLWSDRAWEVDVNMSPMTFIKNTDTIGGGTDVYGAVEGLLRTKTNVDVMVIFTDMQMYEIDSGTTRTFGNILNRYKKELNSNVQVIFWNLAGYDGGAPIKMNNGVMEVSGFSDKMVEVVGKMLKYNDPMVLVKEIEAVEL
jgi:hypothetical protein